MRQGFIVLSREITEHHLVGIHNPEWFAAWTWMLVEASWRDRRLNLSGKTVELQRGQFSHSYRFMADKWGWTIGKVQRFLKRLKSDTMIDTDISNGQVIVTICNYRKYQDIDERPEPSGDTPNDTEAIQERYSSDTKKNKLNKLNKDNTPQNHFQEWYDLYPNKKAKKAAQKAYDQILKKGEATHEDLVNGVKRFVLDVKTRKTEKTFIPHPAT